MTYIGLGRKSQPDTYDPLYQPAIFVVNQEFYRQLSTAFQYSVALSYRKQNQYLSEPPYQNASPDTKQEFRAYGRFAYNLQTAKLKFAATFRQEFRKFHSASVEKQQEDLQLRSRLKLQLSTYLDPEKQHSLSGSTELLFGISKEKLPASWTGFAYQETRFTAYYSLAPKATPLVFSVGYMNDLIGTTKPHSVHYLAFDIVVKNPFSKTKTHTKH